MSDLLLDYRDEAAAIRAHFEEAWESAFWDKPVPVAYENVSFTPPRTDDGEPLPWARLAVLGGMANQADMARKPRYRHTGAVIVQVFTRHGTGDSEARRLAEAAARIFRGKTIGRAVFTVQGDAPAVQTVGSDGTYYQLNMRAPFYLDRIH